MTSSTRSRYKELIEEYGLVVVAIYLSTSILVGVPAWIMISLGFEGFTELAEKAADSGGETVETGSTLFLTWLVLKATQLPRLAFTVALTPFVGRYVDRRLHKDDEPDEAEPDEAKHDGAEAEPDEAKHDGAEAEPDEAKHDGAEAEPDEARPDGADAQPATPSEEPPCPPA